MKKFKIWLIHLLGGMTVSESMESDKKSAYLGAYTALYLIKGYAESLNGKLADEWCKLVYERICRQLESVANGTDEERPTGK